MATPAADEQRDQQDGEPVRGQPAEEGGSPLDPAEALVLGVDGVPGRALAGACAAGGVGANSTSRALVAFEDVRGGTGGHGFSG